MAYYVKTYGEPQIIVVHGPTRTKALQTVGSWSTPLCACFDDCGICVQGFFCPCCLGCRVADAMDEPCWVPTCLLGALWPMRLKTRLIHNIKGSLCKDWFATTCCYGCALCQIAREFKAHGQL